MKHVKPCTHLSGQTYIACAVWCGGHQELKTQRERRSDGGKGEGRGSAYAVIIQIFR